MSRQILPIYHDEVVVGIEKGDRVYMPINMVKSVQVDLEHGTATLTLINNETIDVTPEQAGLFIHYNQIWRPL
ncbi:hypothetical protein [Burkholderia gladioli]|uniref:hypothetical protein n=1 Tax=Burkholderia gladioli TaxID=28095 RepID=UPI002FE01B94